MIFGAAEKNIRKIPNLSKSSFQKTDIMSPSVESLGLGLQFNPKPNYMWFSPSVILLLTYCLQFRYFSLKKNVMTGIPPAKVKIIVKL